MDTVDTKWYWNIISETHLRHSNTGSQDERIIVERKNEFNHIFS